MLLYFILGIVFISLGVPILEALSSVISALSQYIVYLFAFKIYKVKKQMGQTEQDQQEQKLPMGFAVSAIGDQVQLYPEEDQEQEE